VQEPTSAPVSACVDNFSAATLDHTEDRFYLPALAVAALMQVAFHLPAVTPDRFFVGWSAMLGRNEGLNPEFFTSQPVGRFAVETGVGSQRLRSGHAECVTEQGLEVSEVRVGTLARSSRQDEMAGGVADNSQLGKSPVHDFPLSPLLSRRFTPLGEVAAGVLRLEPAGVDRSQTYAAAEHAMALGLLHGDGQQLSKRANHQQSLGRLLQCREVGNHFQLDHLPQVRAIFQQSCHRAVREAVKIFQHEAGEELMLRELLGTVAMRILRQRLSGHKISHMQDQLRRPRTRHATQYEYRLLPV
jgi:hypothetical protein